MTKGEVWREWADYSKTGIFSTFTLTWNRFAARTMIPVSCKTESNSASEKLHGTDLDTHLSLLLCEHVCLIAAYFAPRPHVSKTVFVLCSRSLRCKRFAVNVFYECSWQKWFEGYFTNLRKVEQRCICMHLSCRFIQRTALTLAAEVVCVTHEVAVAEITEQGGGGTVKTVACLLGSKTEFRLG